MSQTAVDSTAEQHSQVLDRYVEFWNAEDGDEQRRTAGVVFDDRVEYRAPVGILTGAEALINFRDQFTDHMGAAVLAVRQAPEIHHDRARLLWEIRLGGGTSFAAGTDVIAFGSDGRISSVTSFLDRAPEGFQLPHHD